ncbi:MAG: hypothetical protein ACTSXA_00205 [Candidatus Heimdallarchaeota archaeon]
MEKRKIFHNEVKGFCNLIIKYIESKKNTEKYKPDKFNKMLKADVDKYSYDENGLEVAYNLEYVDGNFWFSAKGILYEQIKELKVYKEFSKRLKVKFPKEDITTALRDFSFRLISLFFHKKLTDQIIDETITIFLKELNDEVLDCIIYSEIQDLVIDSNPIQFKINDAIYLIRATTIEDLEKTDFEYVIIRRLKYKPDAQCKIICKFTHTSEIMNKLKQALAILLLYKLSSVAILNEKHSTDSIIINKMQSYSYSNHLDTKPKSFKKLILREGEENELIDFWRKMNKLLPTDFYKLKEKPLNFKSIAYLRYKEALFQYNSFEEQIANAVMGLEAIFLRDEDKGELNFRLKLRVAKLFGLLNIDQPLKIKKFIGKAYGIRSKYVHGGLLSIKEYKKISDIFSSIIEFRDYILNLLRKSILLTIYLGFKKEKLHKLIDDSLIDEIENRKFFEILSKNIPEGNGLQITQKLVSIKDSKKQEIFSDKLFFSTNNTIQDNEVILSNLKKKFNYDDSLDVEFI